MQTLRNFRKTTTMPDQVRLALSPTFNLGELKPMDRFGTLIKVEAGRALTTEGHIGTEAFVIVDGSAQVTRDGNQVANVGNGSVIGETAVMTTSRRNATVTTTTDVLLYAFGPQEFRSGLASCPSLAAKVQDLATVRTA